MEPVHTGSRRVSSISAGILTTLRAFARASECSFGRVKEPTCVCVCVCGDEPSEGRNEKRTEKEGTGDRECLSRPFLKRVKRNERIAASRRSSSSRFFYFFLFSVKWLLVIICWFVVSFFFLSLSLSLSRLFVETRKLAGGEGRSHSDRIVSLTLNAVRTTALGKCLIYARRRPGGMIFIATAYILSVQLAFPFRGKYR